MELAIYIKNLLYNQETVIIPEFGALQTKYKPAEINPADHTIAPPSRYLIFDKDKIKPDGVLVNFIASQNNISKEKAENYVSAQVRSLLEKLDANETISLEGIGYFSKEGGAIRFDKDPEANFLTDSFGLSQIGYKPVEIKLEPKPRQEETIASATTVTSIPPVKKKSYKTAIALIAALLIIGGATAYYLYNPKIVNQLKNAFQKQFMAEQPEKTNSSPQAQISDTTALSDIENDVEHTTDKKRALALSKNPANPGSVNAMGTATYYIIAGSFKNFERASILAKNLKKEGFKTEVIQFDLELFRVSLGEFKTKPEGLAELEKIRAVKGESTVWLLTKQL